MEYLVRKANEDAEENSKPIIEYVKSKVSGTNCSDEMFKAYCIATCDVMIEKTENLEIIISTQAVRKYLNDTL